MFSLGNKKNDVTKNSPSNIDINSEFIHTMEDALSPSARSSEKNNSVVIADKKKLTSSAATSSSPFLNQTENKPSSAATSPSVDNLKKSIPVSETVPLGSKTLSSSQEDTKNETFEKNDSPFPIKNIPKKQFLTGKLLIIILSSLLIITIISGTIYYFLIVKQSPESEFSEIPSTQTESPVEIANEQQILITPISEKYSYEKPNYLPINIELSSSDEIKKIISSTANEIKDIQTKNPFEFIVTDSNNNPIAFPIFSVASNLNLSSELLVNLEEEFSFFIFNDNGNTRTGIVIEMKNENNALAQLQKEEPSLVNSLSFLFLTEPTAPEKTVFKSGIYNGTTVRYINLTSDINPLSIDYAAFNNKLIIATSKDTLHAIVDNLAKQQGIIQTLPAESSEQGNTNSSNIIEGSPVDNIIDVQTPAAL